MFKLSIFNFLLLHVFVEAQNVGYPSINGRYISRYSQKTQPFRLVQNDWYRDAEPPLFSIVNNNKLNNNNFVNVNNKQFKTFSSQTYYPGQEEVGKNNQYPPSTSIQQPLPQNRVYQLNSIPQPNQYSNNHISPPNYISRYNGNAPSYRPNNVDQLYNQPIRYNPSNNQAIAYYLPNQLPVLNGGEYISEYNRNEPKKPPVLLIGNFPAVNRQHPGGFPYIPPTTKQSLFVTKYQPPNPVTFSPNKVLPPSFSPEEYGLPPNNPYDSIPKEPTFWPPPRPVSQPSPPYIENPNKQKSPSEGYENTPYKPQEPTSPGSPQRPSYSGGPELPQVPNGPGVPQRPGSPGQPKESNKLLFPGKPQEHRGPEISGEPDLPQNPYGPREPQGPGSPGKSEEPKQPQGPKEPSFPDPYQITIPPFFPTLLPSTKVPKFKTSRPEFTTPSKSQPSTSEHPIFSTQTSGPLEIYVPTLPTLTTSVSTSGPEVPVPNKIRGKAKVICKESGIDFGVKTIFPFTGQIFAYDRKRVPNCLHNFNQATNINITFSYADCGIRNAGNETNLQEQFHLQIIVMFEQPDKSTFLQSFFAQCAQRKIEYNKQVIPKRIEEALEELRLVPTQLEQKASVPDCLLRIVTDVEHHKPGDGIDVDKVNVGQPLRVEFSLQPESDAYGFLVRNCMVKNLITGTQHEVIDEKGCSTDLNIFAHPHYDTYHDIARVHWHAFKLPDHTQLSLTCQYDICLEITDEKNEKSCSNLPTPPFCADIETSPSNSILFDTNVVKRSVFDDKDFETTMKARSDLIGENNANIVTTFFNTTTKKKLKDIKVAESEVVESKNNKRYNSDIDFKVKYLNNEVINLPEIFSQSVHANICFSKNLAKLKNNKFDFKFNKDDNFCESEAYVTEKLRHLQLMDNQGYYAAVEIINEVECTLRSFIIVATLLSTAIFSFSILLNLVLYYRRQKSSFMLSN